MIFFLIIMVLIILSLAFWDIRYKQNHGKEVPDGFERTEEVSIDPVNGKKYRVYFNPDTGERFYFEEEQ